MVLHCQLDLRSQAQSDAYYYKIDRHVILAQRLGLIQNSCA